MGSGLPFFYLHFYLFKEDRMKKVAVIMGSDSDWPVVKGACQQLETFGIPYEAHILSAPLLVVTSRKGSGSSSARPAMGP